MNRHQRRAAKHRKEPEAYMKFIEEDDDLVLYVFYDGTKIAKRYSGQNWISLEPGFTVRGTEPGGDYNTISIEFNPDSAQPQ